METTPFGGKEFCDSEFNELSTFTGKQNCEECPAYGFCQKGRLISCEEGYSLNSFTAICIKVEENTKLTMEILKEIRNYLENQLNRAGVKENGIKTKVSKVKKVLQKKILHFETDIIFDKAFEESISLIKKYENKGITIENENSVFVYNPKNLTFSRIIRNYWVEVVVMGLIFFGLKKYFIDDKINI
jgi:hypothetical protein